MRIFIIARGYPSPQEPTWGCFEKDQAEALVQLGHNVTIISIDTRFRWHKRKFGLTQLNFGNLDIYNLFIIPLSLLFFIPKSWRYKLVSYTYLKLFQHVVRKKGMPDILYAHYLRYMFYGIDIQKKYNIPLVGIEHWSKIGEKSIHPRIKKSARNIYPQLDQLLTVSSSLKYNIQQQIGNINDILVTNNMVGKEFFYSSKSNEKSLKIVSAGGLIYRKGYDLLIEALSHIKHLPDNWQLTIIGNGPLKQELQTLVQQKGLQKHIHLIGQKSKIDIVSQFQESDFFVLPSRSETFGVVYIEAMACGLPIIATDCGGPRDIVTESNGLLILNEDIDALSNAILYMIKNINQYDRKAIAENCQARFSSEVIAKQLTQIFEDTIKKHKEK